MRDADRTSGDGFGTDLAVCDEPSLY